MKPAVQKKMQGSECPTQYTAARRAGSYFSHLLYLRVLTADAVCAPVTVHGCFSTIVGLCPTGEAVKHKTVQNESLRQTSFAIDRSTPFPMRRRIVFSCFRDVPGMHVFPSQQQAKYTVTYTRYTSIVIVTAVDHADQ